jgi:hypothetical protein
MYLAERDCVVQDADEYERIVGRPYGTEETPPPPIIPSRWALFPPTKKRRTGVRVSAAIAEGQEPGEVVNDAIG